jgi:hypothetical protein
LGKMGPKLENMMAKLEKLNSKLESDIPSKETKVSPTEKAFGSSQKQ